MKSKITITEIAAACGVTTATVSRVINNQPGVRKEVRKFVQRYIDQLGWQCSSLKTRLPKLSGGKTVFILCRANLLNGGGRYSAQEALQLLIERLEAEGFLPFTIFGQTMQILEKCREFKPHAVVLFTKNSWMEEPIRKLIKQGIRVVAAYGNEFSGSCPQVHSDYADAVKKAVRRFRALGCSKIGLFAGNGLHVHPETLEDIPMSWVRSIAEALENSLPDFSLKGNVISDNFGARGELRNCLENRRFDGWICCGRTMLYQFTQEAESAGLRIPEDLPVLAFSSGNLEFEPPLRVGHFVSQTALIADQLFRWISAEVFPETVEVALPCLFQAGSAEYKTKTNSGGKRE